MAALYPIKLQQLVPPTYAPGRLVQLVDHNMAEAGVVEARELRTASTHYPGGAYREVQLLGVAEEDLELTGLLRDAWGGPGYAANARLALRDLQLAQHPIWLSWGLTWARLVILKRVEITHDNGGLRYRLTLEHLDLAEDNDTPPTLTDPGEGARTLDTVAAELDTLAALELPEGL